MGTGQGPVVGPLSAREAAARIVAAVGPLGTERLALDDALGQVLAEPILSPIDIPAWTNSAMDGYAARGDDVRGASLEHARVLTVVEQVPAGSFPTRALGPGECARIFTGAPLPEGADTVIRQEDTDGGSERVVITRDRDVGLNIRRAGEDIRRGATVLEPGAPLGAAQLGVLASLAVARPLVHRRPLVAILGGGDEIVDIDQPEEILSGR
jgi:molybdopterin molybdotransferase